jgi:uncharacterized membrane protein YhfC
VVLFAPLNIYVSRFLIKKYGRALANIFMVFMFTKVFLDRLLSIFIIDMNGGFKDEVQR